MPRLIPVVRVSTRDQADNGVSLDAQADRLHKWAELNGYEWTEPVELPGIGGTSNKARLIVVDAMKRLRPHSGDALAAYSLSRLSRSTRNLMDIADQLHKMGCNLVSLTESLDTGTATGKLVFRILSVLAEFERDIISERTTAALAHKRQNGEKTGGRVPYGYDDVEGRLVGNPQEQDVILSIKTLADGCSLREICGWLEDHKVKPKIGNHWSPNTIRGILRREGKT